MQKIRDFDYMIFNKEFHNFRRLKIFSGIIFINPIIYFQIGSHK